jgi:hypothetical protein
MQHRQGRCVRHAAPAGKMRNENKILPGKPKRKRTLARSGIKGKDNIKLNLKKLDVMV